MPMSFRGVASLALPAALLCVSAPACVDISAGEAQYVETVEKRYTVTGTPTLKIGTFDGSVDVATWDRPEVLVVIEKHAVDKSAADRMVVTAEQNGDEIRVDVRHERDGGVHINFGSHYARMTITVPSQAQVDAATGDGRVTVRDLTGNLNVRTGDGSIRLENISGVVDARSGDGSIEVDGTLRGLRARSGDGRVVVRATGSGPSTDWNLATGDGSVVLEVPNGFGAELDAATGDGHVEVRGVPFSSGSSERNRRVARGRIGDGGGRITIRSGDGSIVVRTIGSQS